MWLRVFLVIVLFASLGGCASLARHNRKVFAKQVKESLVYVKDHKTGLCFAAAEGLSLVVVPCEKVPKGK